MIPDQEAVEGNHWVVAPEAAARPVLLLGRLARWVDAPPPAPLTLLTACDGNSLDAAAALVRSADVYSPGLVLVLHLVAPSSDDLERARRIRTWLSNTTLVLSTEDVLLGALDPAARRAYVDAARFFRLADALPAQGAVLTLPPQALVVGPLDVQALPASPCAAAANVWLLRGQPALPALLHHAHELTARFEPGRPAAAPVPAPDPLDARLADPALGDDASVWVGPTDQPPTDIRFLVLQRLLAPDTRDRLVALRIAAEMLPGAHVHWPRLAQRLRSAQDRLPAWVALFVPRLDQPWGAAGAAPLPPTIAADTLALRMHWKEFSSRLANALERQGIRVEMFEWPLREIVTENVDSLGASLALVPHRCQLDYVAGRTPVAFYMQEYFRWVFVVDRQGWSAASSRYPVRPEWFAQAPEGSYDTYRARSAAGNLTSKFGQPPATTRAALEAAGDIPAGRYLFLPLQIPHDQSIRYFSPVGMDELVDALVDWCRKAQVPLVLKPHPANAKAMAPYESLPRSPWLYWSRAGVHDLIEHAEAVVTINSGVGFEALFQNKPVVTFGRAEYDCVTIRARTDALDEAWHQVLASTADERMARYRSFVDWFLGSYAVDLSQDERQGPRLDAIAKELARRATGAEPVLSRKSTRTP